MNTILQNQLDRLENSLNTLVDSITSYNPSVQAATDLVKADDDLGKGIKQLTNHQANHVRILHLRENIDTLNQTISSNLTILADTRKDLLATPATIFPGEQRNVPYHELLDYAKRISRYTVPPTFRVQPLASPTPNLAISQPANQSANSALEKQATQDSSAASPKNNEADGEGIGVASLDQGDIQWLDPLKQIPFVPWPSEDIIRQGALAQIQVMLDQKIDPSDISIGVDKAVKDETNAEARVAATTGQVNTHDSVDIAKLNTENGIANVEQREEKPKVFGGLDLYDPDEE